VLAGVLVAKVHLDARDAIRELRQGAFEDLREPLRDFLADSDVVVVIYLHLHAPRILVVSRVTIANARDSQ
jgi:hypothetical protein